MDLADGQHRTVGPVSWRISTAILGFGAAVSRSDGLLPETVRMNNSPTPCVTHRACEHLVSSTLAADCVGSPIHSGSLSRLGTRGLKVRVNGVQSSPKPCHRLSQIGEPPNQEHVSGALPRLRLT